MQPDFGAVPGQPAPGQPGPGDMPGPGGMPGPGPGGMPGPGPQAPVRKQNFNVYTMMLIISFLALVTGCVLLWLELSDYLEGNAWPPWDTSRVPLSMVEHLPLISSLF